MLLGFLSLSKILGFTATLTVLCTVLEETIEVLGCCDFSVVRGIGATLMQDGKSDLVGLDGLDGLVRCLIGWLD